MTQLAMSNVATTPAAPQISSLKSKIPTTKGSNNV